MRVTNSYNPYAYQQRKASHKRTGFADMLANQAKTANNTATSTPTASNAIGAQKSEDTTSFAIDTIWKSAMENRPNADNYPAALTQEQIDDLKSRHDIENMKRPSQEAAAFAEELFDLGVISDEQRKFFYGGMVYDNPPPFVATIVPVGEESPVKPTYIPEPSDSMIDYLIKSLEVVQSHKDFLSSPDTPDKKAIPVLTEGFSQEQHLASMDRYITRYQGLLDVLQQFTA